MGGLHPRRRHLVARERAAQLHRPRAQRRVRGRGRGRGRGRAGGADAGLSAPVIGLCTALEQARWGAWDQQAVLLPRNYVDAVQAAGGIALLLPPDPAAVEDPDRLLDLRRRAAARRRRGHGPRHLRRRAASRDGRHGARARRLRARAGRARDGARPAVPRHLPRDAGDERRARRHAQPAPARRPRPRGPPALARLVRRTPTTTCGSRRARSPRARRARSATGPSRTTTRASTRIGEGLTVSGWATLDELPEALEVEGSRFTLGVQWHPEADTTSPLIAALVEQARADKEEELTWHGWTGRSASSPGRRAASAPRPRSGSSRRARPSSASTSATTASAPWRAPTDVADEQQVSDLYNGVRDGVRPDRRAVQQRGHLPHRRRLRARHDARGLAARAGRQPQVGLPLLQARDPAPDRGRRRLGDQHRVVRGHDGQRDVADLLHGLQGRRARRSRASSAWSSRAAACASTRSARAR